MSAPDEYERVPIAKIQRSGREEIQVELVRLKDGRWRCGLRVWFVATDGELRPSRDGFTLPVECLSGLKNAIEGATREARDRGAME